MAFGTPVGVNDNRSLNTSDVVFDSFESVAGELLVMSVTLAGTGSQIPDSIVGHDGGKPWVQIGVTEQAGIRHSQSLWACHSSGATEVITVAYAVSQVMGCDLTRVTGADVSGTVENSFKDFKSNNGYATTVTTDALTDSDLTLGFYSIFSNRVLVTENTELLNYKYSYSQKSHATDYDVAGDLTPTCSIGAFATYSCQVCGIKAAPPTTVPRPLQLPKNVQNGFRLPNKKPLGEFELDRANPLTRGLSHAWIVGDTKEVPDIAGGWDAEYVSNTKTTDFNHGRGHECLEAGADVVGGIWTKNERVLDPSEKFSVVFIYKDGMINTSGRSERMLGYGTVDNLGNTDPVWALSRSTNWNNNAVDDFAMRFNSWGFSDSKHEDGWVYKSPKTHIFGFDKINTSGATHTRLHIDGKYHSDVANNANTIKEGTRAYKYAISGTPTESDNGEFYARGRYQIFAVLHYQGRNLTSAEHESLGRDFYQILKPKTPQSYYVPKEIQQAIVVRPLQLPKQVHPDFRLPNKLPLGDVEIDRSHPLANNIVAAVMVRGNGVELLHGVRSTVTGSPKKYKGGTWFSKAGLDSIKIPLPSNDMNWCENSGLTIAVATSHLSGSADYETAFEINNSANPT